MQKIPSVADYLKIILNLFIIGFLAVMTFFIMKPFLFGMFWAVMVVIATWGILIWLQQCLKSRILAASILTLLIASIFISPMLLGIQHLVQNSSEIMNWFKSIPELQLPTLDWLEKIPYFGVELHQNWLEFVQSEDIHLLNKLRPYFLQATSWGVTQLGNLSHLLLHCLFMVIFCFFFYWKGEKLAKKVLFLANHLAGKNGVYTVNLATQATRAVALGIVGTALIQATFASIILHIMNIPYALLLSIVVFILCVAQLGPLLVLIPSTIWLYFNGTLSSAIILGCITIFLSVVDNLIRPLLIKKGVNLPLSLILLGVFGGIIGFGIIGLFIGPVILAVSYKLLSAWTKLDAFFGESSPEQVESKESNSQ